MNTTGTSTKACENANKVEESDDTAENANVTNLVKRADSPLPPSQRSKSARGFTSRVESLQKPRDVSPSREELEADRRHETYRRERSSQHRQPSHSAVQKYADGVENYPSNGEAHGSLKGSRDHCIEEKYSPPQKSSNKYRTKLEVGDLRDITDLRNETADCNAKLDARSRPISRGKYHGDFPNSGRQRNDYYEKHQSGKENLFRDDDYVQKPVVAIDVVYDDLSSTEPDCSYRGQTHGQRTQSLGRSLRDRMKDNCSEHSKLVEPGHGVNRNRFARSDERYSQPSVKRENSHNDFSRSNESDGRKNTHMGNYPHRNGHFDSNNCEIDRFGFDRFGVDEFGFDKYGNFVFFLW